MNNIPYTYLIGWSAHDKWYYGVRYSSKAHPSDLWVSYFTSSKQVKKYRLRFGEPDIVEVRRTFSSPHSAKLWEEKVLNRINVRTNPKWINLSQPNSFKGTCVPWNKGLTKESSMLLQEISTKISKSCQGRPSPRKGYRATPDELVERSWRQIKDKVPFSSYQEFMDDVRDMVSKGMGPYAVASIYGIDGSVIRRIVGRDKCNQSWTKLKKNHPDLPFDTYAELALFCKDRIDSGKSRWSVVKELGISEDAVKRAINHAS